MPHKFWQAQYGAGLRKIIAEGRHLQSVIDFGDQQVFRGATTYTALQVLGRAPSDSPIEYAKVVDLVDGESQCRAIDARKPGEGVLSFRAAREMPVACWAFIDTAGTEIINSLTLQGPTLGALAARVFVGL